MKSALFVFALLSFFLPSCHKEKMTGLTLERYRNILDSTKLVCNGITSEYYISANINGRPVCYSNGEDGYIIDTKSYNMFTTAGTSVNIGDTSSSDFRVGFQLEAFHDIEDYVNNFLIVSPKWKGNHPIKDVLDRYLIVGKHTVLGSNTPDSIGFNIGFYVCHDKNVKGPGTYSYHHLDILSGGGIQDRNSYLEFTKVEKYISAEHIVYDIEAKFQCQLYHAQSSPEEGKLYGNLTDGQLVMQIVVDN